MPLLPPFGSPADQDYVTFAKWIDDGIVGKAKQGRCWWSPQFTGWFPFSLSSYEHLDFQRLGPASPLDVKSELFAGNTYLLRTSQKAKNCITQSVTPIGRSMTRYPTAAWNVYSGDWRAMRGKGQTTPIVNRTRSPRAVVEGKIAEFKELYRAGVITDEQLDKMILDILREY